MNKLKELETQFNSIVTPSVNLDQGIKLTVNQNGVLTITQNVINSRTNNQLDLNPDQVQTIFNYLKNTLNYV